MTNPPQPTEQEVASLLVSQADELGIGMGKLMVLARDGVLRLHEDEEGKVKHRGMTLVFATDSEWPTLITVM